MLTGAEEMVSDTGVSAHVRDDSAGGGAVVGERVGGRVGTRVGPRVVELVSTMLGTRVVWPGVAGVALGVTLGTRVGARVVASVGSCVVGGAGGEPLDWTVASNPAFCTLVSDESTTKALLASTTTVSPAPEPLRERTRALPAAVLPLYTFTKS